MRGRSRPHWVVLGLGVPLIAAGPALAADTYTANARFTNAEGERVTTPVTISLDGVNETDEHLHNAKQRFARSQDNFLVDELQSAVARDKRSAFRRRAFRHAVETRLLRARVFADAFA